MRNKGNTTAQMQRWRERHREHYNEYQKLYKRKVRGYKKAIYSTQNQ